MLVNCHAIFTTVFNLWPSTNSKKMIFQTPSKGFSNAKPYEAPKPTPTPPTFTGGYNQIQSGKLQA